MRVVVPEQAGLIRPRLRTAAFLLLLAAFSWPAMMGIHEVGHVLGAWAGGGRVERVVWHPLLFSRTDVRPDPRRC